MAKTVAERMKDYRLRGGEKLKKKNLVVMTARKKAIKLKVLSFYGGGKAVCTQCEEGRTDCLSIDHINGDGAIQRRENGKQGTALYQWLIKNKYPPGYQTLCMNCQWIKRFSRKEYNHLSRKSNSPSL